MQNNVVKIEQALVEFLQSDIELYIGKKKYRHGKLKNFKMFDLYVQLLLSTNGKERKVELPMPFVFERNKTGIAFSYRISDMGSYGVDLLEKIQKHLGIPKSKLYNNVLMIKRS